MPVRDDDLTRALRQVAPTVDPSQAYEGVVGKRTRRRAARRARVGALAVVAALVVVSGVVLVSRDEQSARVTTPVAPAPKGWTPLELTTDEGYLRGPLSVSHVGERALVSVAAYDRDGSGFTFPPSRIVRFDPKTLQLVDRVNLKAEILSVADGPRGTRFAVTRNPDPDGPSPAAVFLKSIAPDGTVRSVDLELGTTVTGPVAVVGNEVHVPTDSMSVVFDFDLAPVPVRYPNPVLEPSPVAPPGTVDAAVARIGSNTYFATSAGGLLRHRVG